MLFRSPRPFQFLRQGDEFGWREQINGNLFLGLYVETGRIKDKDGYNLKTALREAISQFPLEIRLTPSQNILLANIRKSDQGAIDAIFRKHGVPTENQGTILRRASMACPAMPTCGLALAESERALPDILGRIEGLLGELGLASEEIVIRMTGCPNGCARPYMAEIGFVGRAPNKYQLYLGGNEASTRLNRLYKENVKTDDIVNELRPVLSRFKQERTGAERFGDFCARTLWSANAS